MPIPKSGNRVREENLVEEKVLRIARKLEEIRAKFFPYSLQPLAKIPYRFSEYDEVYIEFEKPIEVKYLLVSYKDGALETPLFSDSLPFRARGIKMIISNL